MKKNADVNSSIRTGGNGQQKGVSQQKKTKNGSFRPQKRRTN